MSFKRKYAFENNQKNLIMYNIPMYKNERNYFKTLINNRKQIF